MTEHNEWSIGLGGKLPIGFGLNLAANESAMEAFTNMSEDEKRQIVAESREQHSKEDMERFVASIGKTDSDLF